MDDISLPLLLALQEKQDTSTEIRVMAKIIENLYKEVETLKARSPLTGPEIDKLRKEN